jgi:hypothetical protein
MSDRVKAEEYFSRVFLSVRSFGINDFMEYFKSYKTNNTSGIKKGD